MTLRCIRDAEHPARNMASQKREHHIHSIVTLRTGRYFGRGGAEWEQGEVRLGC